MSVTTIDKFSKYELPYTCPLCVLTCSPWIKDNYVQDLSNISSQAPKDLNTQLETATVVPKKTDNSKKVVVIDNISNSISYRSSDKIRKETKQFENLQNSEFAYSLPRGGIKTEEEAGSAVSKWSEEYFGGNCTAHR